MNVAYYYANSDQYGKFFREVADHVNMYMDWEDLTPGSRLIPPGKRLYICLGLNYYDKPMVEVVRSAIRKLRTVWKRIDFMELGDEPKWTAREIEETCQMIRAECADAKLPTPPLGCVFTETQIMRGQTWKAKGLDWIGLEGYIMEKPGEKPDRTKRRVLECLTAQRSRIGKKPAVIVGQSYDRNGTWKDMETLLAVNEATWNYCKETGAKALNWFSYARPGGAKTHKELALLHKKLYNG